MVGAYRRGLSGHIDRLDGSAALMTAFIVRELPVLMIELETEESPKIAPRFALA